MLHSVEIILYKNSSGDDYFDKALSEATTVTCNLKNPVDVEKPSFEIMANNGYDTFNYCYIAEFGRYYWMHAVAGNNQTITFECESDPLMSFKGQIRTCPAVISRNPWHFDLYIPDDKMPIEARHASAIIKFPNNHFSGDNNVYVLTTIGGGV